MNKKRVIVILFPILAAMIRGVSLVSQSISAGYIGAFTFNASRAFVASLVLALMIFIGSKKSAKPIKTDPKVLLIGGTCCGGMLFIATNLQQIGMAATSAGKAGFITVLYIVLVPIMGVFLKKKVSLALWISMPFAVLGIYLLCIKDTFTITSSDKYIILCAVAFAIHILVLDQFSAQTDPFELNCAQFLVLATLSAITALIFEHPTWSQIRPCLGQILYVGIISSALAYNLQIIAQKNGNPAAVSLLLSLESAFGVISGAVFLAEKLTVREYIGCFVMLIAVLLAQVPSRLFAKKKRLVF